MNEKKGKLNKHTEIRKQKENKTRTEQRILKKNKKPRNKQINLTSTSPSLHPFHLKMSIRTLKGHS